MQILNAAKIGMEWRRGGLLWLGFYGAILVAWLALFAMIRAAPLAGYDNLPASFWASLCLSAGQAQFGPIFAMWALMAAAMMLPTFIPTLRSFRDLGAVGASDNQGALALIAGYLLIWGGAAAGGAAVQMQLSKAQLLSPLGASQSDLLTALLFLGAGAYQFTTLKAACLAKCRMPLTFFMEHWAPGRRHALRMGLWLGALCLGCCWVLMALGFVGGTMNLLWMGAATLFMALEKLPDIGRKLTRPAGFLLILAGGAMLLRAAGLL